MNRENRKMLRRSITGSLGRFLAILLITALGVGFYAGLKSSQPDMLRAADGFLRRQKLYDFQLMSSLGLTEEDADAFRRLPGIAAAEGACFRDAYVRIEDRDEEVWHFQTLTGQVSVPDLLAGRMPDGPGECLGDSRAFSQADLGQTLTLSESNDADTLDAFTEKSFVLVGLVCSPRYISMDRGSSELGSGKPAGFVLLPAEAFSGEVYHELLLWCDLPGAIYSEEYSDARRHLRPAVEILLNRRGVVRSQALREEAGEELERGRKELEDGWLRFRREQRRARLELAEADCQLQSAEAQLTVGREAFAENERLLAEQESSLARRQRELEQKQNALTRRENAIAGEQAARAELEAREASLKLQRAQLELDKSAALQPYASELAEAYAALLVLQDAQMTQDLSDLTGQLSDTLAGLGIDVSGLEAPLPQDPLAEGALAAAEARRARAQQALDEAQAAQEAPESEFGRRKAALDAEEAKLRQDQEAFAPRRQALEKEEAALREEGEALLTETVELSVTASALSESREMLNESREELESGAAQLAEGRAAYEREKKKAEEELAKARKELEDAERELAEGEAELEEALQPELFTLDRSANSGYVTFENDSAIVDGVAVVFPVFFVLVAALVCITTMTRMVNEERTQIGTLKAMGYSDPVIMAKYLLYAGLSALLGSVLGFFLGATVLPYIVWYAYRIMYQYSGIVFRFSGLMFSACLLVSVAGSLFVTWLACRAALRERPAELIRPKAPGIGKRVLLERLPFLWDHLPFLTKVSFRNAFRYPSRLLMMLLGIGGCTALLVAGFGVKDSLAGVGDYQYDEISLYDITVNLDPEKAGADPCRLWADWAQDAALTRREEVRVLNDGGAGKDTDLILADAEAIRPLLSLHNRKDGDLAWPKPGEVIVTKKIADTLDLKPGGSVTLRLPDGSERGMTVSGVCEYYVGHAVFAAPDGFPDTSGNYALIRVRDGEDAGRRAAGLRAKEGVLYVGLTQTERDTLESSMASIDLLILMLVLCSGALAFITLYNLTNINIMERLREVATVKVLGFTPSETAEYILNENLLLSFLGALLGLVLGRFLHRFVMEMIQLDYMSYDIRIAVMSYVLGFGVTLVFSMLTNLFMRRRLENVNMAESLKSVE